METRSDFLKRLNPAYLVDTPLGLGISYFISLNENYHIHTWIVLLYNGRLVHVANEDIRILFSSRMQTFVEN
jgi:hypothetical protein